MTDEQLAADYSNPAFLSNVMLAAAITDEDIENYIKFSSTNGANVWRDVLAEAARRLTHKLRCASGIAEVVRRDNVERRIWAHYEHAREKHPYFCDTLTHVEPPDNILFMSDCRMQLHRETQRQSVSASAVLQCEIAELFASSRKEHAIEEAYDCIAVLLRIIDVLEGRQKLGRPEDAQCK